MKKRPTRKRIIATLNEVIRWSEYCPLGEVEIQHQDNQFATYSDTMEIFEGSCIRDRLIAFLMDKSLTYRILNIDWSRFVRLDMGQLISMNIYLLGSDDKFLEYTNIDSEMLELIGKARFAGEDI